MNVKKLQHLLFYYTGLAIVALAVLGGGLYLGVRWWAQNRFSSAVRKLRQSLPKPAQNTQSGEERLKTDARLALDRFQTACVLAPHLQQPSILQSWEVALPSEEPRKKEDTFPLRLGAPLPNDMKQSLDEYVHGYRQRMLRRLLPDMGKGFFGAGPEDQYFRASPIPRALNILNLLAELRWFVRYHGWCGKPKRALDHISQMAGVVRISSHVGGRQRSDIMQTGALWLCSSLMGTLSQNPSFAPEALEKARYHIVQTRGSIRKCVLKTYTDLAEQRLEAARYQVSTGGLPVVPFGSASRMTIGHVQVLWPSTLRRAEELERAYRCLSILKSPAVAQAKWAVEHEKARLKKEARAWPRILERLKNSQGKNSQKVVNKGQSSKGEVRFSRVLRTILPRDRYFSLTDLELQVFSNLRARAAINLAMCALAVEQYRMEQGKWPAELSTLVPQYLSAVPSDPYTKKEIVYQHRSSGVILYSVGRNMKDDGGTDAPVVKHKETRRFTAYTGPKDIVFFLLSPKKRGVEP